MIKGCQRKMIMVRGGNSSPFETAYFIMKSLPEHEHLDENDMALEAGRIIAGETSGGKVSSDPYAEKRREKGNRIRLLAAFLIGILIGGAGASFLIALLR